MIKRTFTSLFLTAACLGTLVGTVDARVQNHGNERSETQHLHSSYEVAQSYAIGQSVKILWKGKWYPGEILAISRNGYLVTYYGYDSSWDEWVGPNRLSP